MPARRFSKTGNTRKFPAIANRDDYSVEKERIAGEHLPCANSRLTMRASTNNGEAAQNGAPARSAAAGMLAAVRKTPLNFCNPPTFLPRRAALASARSAAPADV